MIIGFIGLGAMGRHMAASLQRAGHSLRVHDLRREAGDELVKGGATWTASIADAAKGAEIVFTSLPGPKEVEAAASELGKVMQRGSAWFDLTTNSPEVVRRLHASMGERGIALLDAPVSGGPKGAASGKLALWVGGEEALFQKYLPVLKAIGDQPYYVGPIGAGTIAKLAHNCASFSIQAVLAEIMTLGVKAGVEPLALFRAIRQGATGRARTFDRLPDFFLSGSFDPPAFAMSLAHKDMTLAMELARKNGVPMKMGEAALAELDEALRRGWANRDCRAAMTLQEERAGVTVRVPAEKLRGALD
ncbi:MAG TPA: NAD(P)-dependent oxidoreductase [Burkholderiales bacterium]|nr:NAD(P)-dependent oxidoreductase [Burkholderiales bacterium]